MNDLSKLKERVQKLKSRLAEIKPSDGLPDFSAMTDQELLNYLDSKTEEELVNEYLEDLKRPWKQTRKQKAEAERLSKLSDEELFKLAGIKGLDL